MKRVGILGGSFDPIHNGHLLMAELARDKMGLDQVVFVPAFCSPHKLGKVLPAGSRRLAMVKLAIKGNPNFISSDIELKRGGVSYSIDTLRALRARHPKAQLFWITGEDNVRGLSTWKDFPAIIRMAAFIAVSRAWFPVSSSEVRQRLRQKKSIRYLTPDSVIRYIKQHRLYV